MRGSVSKLRHAVVLAVIVGWVVLAALGTVGAGRHDERIETWQTVIEPAGGDAIRVTETFDYDFGNADRHGPLREVPDDFGTPEQLTATSPDAPAHVDAASNGITTRVKIGDPDATVTGQHRYTLSYVLPHAGVEAGQLAVDAFAGDALETGFAQVVVRGFVLGRPECFVGYNGSTDPCELVDTGGVYRAGVGPLKAYTGITVDGAITGMRPMADVDALPLPERRQSRRGAVTLAMLGLGLMAAVPIFLISRRRGRNEVYAGGAADAAFGTLAPPSQARSTSTLPGTTLVTDDRLDDMATIEFVPPKGIAAWEARVLLTEQLGPAVVEDWLSGLAGREAIVLEQHDDKLTIAGGPRRDELSDADEALLASLLGGAGPYVTGTYDKRFATAWTHATAALRERVSASSWWIRGNPARHTKGSRFAGFGLVVVFFVIQIAGKAATSGGSTAVERVFGPPAVALTAGFLTIALVAYLVYKVMLPARSAQGSALTLRAESFRRFLEHSEAKHVEWAWSHGLLREYSGWAVALGEASAWSAALATANVPEPARAMVHPMLFPTFHSSLSSSRTAPSSSGGGSGSGSHGGGSVGGGGGGGSRGSW
jgi:uncharacterized membrane protein YgcG